MTLFIIPTIDDFLEIGLNEVSATLDKSENAMIYDAIGSGAHMAYEISAFAKSAFDKMDVENNFGSDLDRFVFMRTGLIRKSGTFATTDLKFTGTAGTTIPQGFMVSNQDGTVIFKTNYGDIIASDGTLTIPATATVGGYLGYIAPDTITVMPSILAGVTSVTNPSEIVDGTNPETDVQLRSRYYLYYQDRATSNNPAHYRQWAMEVSGVGQARVVRAFNGPLTVKVILLDSQYLPADSELCQTVYDHILTRQSFDVDELSVVGATPVELNISVELKLVAGYADSEVKNKIADKLRTWLMTYADPLYVRETVSYYDIISIIKQTEGVIDIVTLAVNGGTSNIPVGIDQAAVVGRWCNERILL